MTDEQKIASMFGLSVGELRAMPEPDGEDAGHDERSDKRRRAGMTDAEKIADTFGQDFGPKGTPTSQERREALLSSLTGDERSVAVAFGMSSEAIADMIAESNEEITPAKAVARLNALGKAGQGRLLAVNPAAGHRLYELAANADKSFCALRDATADLVRASGGKAPAVHALRGAPSASPAPRVEATRLGVLSLDVVALSAKGEPPTAFRIFRAGANDTTKGIFLFNAASQASVMEAATKHGADLPIDYEHKMLNPNASIGDMIAAGKFKLGIRNGELWAENVRWTPKAAAHLRAGEWSYISPAFLSDKDGQVRSMINVALTNLPATHQLEALVAASRSVA